MLTLQANNTCYASHLNSAPWAGFCFLPGFVEKVAALSAFEYLEKRAKRGSRETFLEILNKVPDVEPEAYDKL